jgi:hypothetical protein
MFLLNASTQKDSIRKQWPQSKIFSIIRVNGQKHMAASCEITLSTGAVNWPDAGQRNNNRAVGGASAIRHIR